MTIAELADAVAAFLHDGLWQDEFDDPQLERIIDVQVKPLLTMLCSRVGHDYDAVRCRRCLAPLQRPSSITAVLAPVDPTPLPPSPLP